MKVADYGGQSQTSQLKAYTGNPADRREDGASSCFYFDGINLLPSLGDVDLSRIVDGHR